MLVTDKVKIIWSGDSLARWPIDVLAVLLLFGFVFQNHELLFYGWAGRDLNGGGLIFIWLPCICFIIS